MVIHRLESLAVDLHPLQRRFIQISSQIFLSRFRVVGIFSA